VKMDVTSLPVTVSNIQFTLGGTHDNNDLVSYHIYFNPTAPTVFGASFMAANIPATFAAPHTYNTPFTVSGSQTIAAGSSGYFIIVVNINATATSGNTVKVNGLTNPVTFGYTTSPPITNNQTDVAVTQTISSILPLTLLSFNGSLLNTQGVLLKWVTASEINTKHFEIEWSVTGQQFSKIAAQLAAGNSSQTLQYNYLHSQPVSGNNFYKLKMVDVDGRFAYSPIVVVNHQNELSSVKIFPNPVANMLHLYIPSQKKETIIYRLHNTDGRYIASKKIELVKGNNYSDWNIENLPAGNYFLSTDNKIFEPIKISKK
jgi:Secretion system C-terminal sorting domain